MDDAEDVGVRLFVVVVVVVVVMVVRVGMGVIMMAMRIAVVMTMVVVMAMGMIMVMTVTIAVAVIMTMTMVMVVARGRRVVQPELRDSVSHNAPQVAHSTQRIADVVFHVRGKSEKQRLGGAADKRDSRCKD